MKGILAVLKYDAKTAQDSDDWAEWADALILSLSQAGFTGLVTQAHGNVRKSDPDWQQRLQHYIDQQSILLDNAYDAGLEVVLSGGNPLNAGWGKVGEGNPAHALYCHPAVIALKIGDEPDRDEWNGQAPKRQALTEAYPHKPLYSVFIGETIGGPTTMNGSPAPEPTLDSLPMYRQFWSEEKNLQRWVRSYPIRSRNNRGEVGDYDVYNPYCPKKLAVPFPEMCRLMEREGGWNLVMQTHGKGVEIGQDNYWRFPTKTELLQMAGIADNYNVQRIACYTAIHDDPRAVVLWDSEFRPTKAHDGSYPIDAIADIRGLYC